MFCKKTLIKPEKKSKTLLPEWNIVLTLHTSFTQFLVSVKNMKQRKQTVCIYMKSRRLQKIFYCDDEYCWVRHSSPDTLNIDVLWNKSSMKEISVHFCSVCLWVCRSPLQPQFPISSKPPDSADEKHHFGSWTLDLLAYCCLNQLVNLCYCVTFLNSS